MRVFAPERLMTSLWQGCRLFLPLTGEWQQLPDYFRQVTRNQPVNDVVHAKLVDGIGDSFTYPDLNASAGGNIYSLTQTSSYGASLGISRYHYKMVKRFVELAPSPNYKGKKQTRRFVERYIPEGSAYAAVCRTVGYFTRYWYVQSIIDVFVPASNAKQREQGLASQISIKGNWSGRKYEEAVFSFTVSGKNGHLIAPLLTHVQDCARSFMGREAPKGVDSIGLSTQLARALEQDIADHGDAILYYAAAKPQSSYWWTMSTSVDQKPFNAGDLRDAFLLHEADIYADRLDPIMLGTSGGLANHWIGYLTQHALLEACDSLPRLSENSITNIMEVVGFIKSLVVDHKIEIPTSLSDAWLSYRYQYLTTKADINDAIKFVHRHMDLGSLDRMIVGRGHSSIEISGTVVSCRCSVEVTPKEGNWLAKIWRALDQYGLTPDFYYIWDTVPYSFMVDWFLPISDIVSVWDANAMYFSGEFYNLANICYSLSYTRDLDRGGGNVDHVKCYTRWAGSVPSSLSSYYWFEQPGASMKTVGQRILDTASLFMGRA